MQLPHDVRWPLGTLAALNPLGLLPSTPCLLEVQVPGRLGGSSTRGPFWIQQEEQVRNSRDHGRGWCRLRKEKSTGRQLSVPPCCATHSVILALVWLPDPTGLEAQDEMAPRRSAILSHLGACRSETPNVSFIQQILYQLLSSWPVLQKQLIS